MANPIGFLGPQTARQVVNLLDGGGLKAGQTAAVNRANNYGDITITSTPQIELMLVGEPYVGATWLVVSSPPYLYNCRRYQRAYNVDGTRLPYISTDIIYSQTPLTAGTYLNCVWCANHWEPIAAPADIVPSGSPSIPTPQDCGCASGPLAKIWFSLAGTGLPANMQGVQWQVPFEAFDPVYGTTVFRLDSAYTADGYLLLADIVTTCDSNTGICTITAISIQYSCTNPPWAGFNWTGTEPIAEGEPGIVTSGSVVATVSCGDSTCGACDSDTITMTFGGSFVQNTANINAYCPAAGTLAQPPDLTLTRLDANTWFAAINIVTGQKLYVPADVPMPENTSRSQWWQYYIYKNGPQIGGGIPDSSMSASVTASNYVSSYGVPPTLIMFALGNACVNNINNAWDNGRQNNSGTYLYSEGNVTLACSGEISHSASPSPSVEECTPSGTNVSPTPQFVHQIVDGTCNVYEFSCYNNGVYLYIGDAGSLQYTVGDEPTDKWYPSTGVICGACPVSPSPSVGDCIPTGDPLELMCYGGNTYEFFNSDSDWINFNCFGIGDIRYSILDGLWYDAMGAETITGISCGACISPSTSPSTSVSISPSTSISPSSPVQCESTGAPGESFCYGGKTYTNPSNQEALEFRYYTASDSSTITWTLGAWDISGEIGCGPCDSPSVPSACPGDVCYGGLTYYVGMAGNDYQNWHTDPEIEPILIISFRFSDGTYHDGPGTDSGNPDDWGAIITGVVCGACA